MSEATPENKFRGLSDRILSLIDFLPCKSCCKVVSLRDSITQKRDRHRIIDVALGGIITMLVLGFIVAKLDPFGLNWASDMYSETIINRVTSPFYQSEAQDQIAIVLIDEATLAEQEIGWPPTYDYYTQLLYRIMRQRPKVVFMDVLLESVRPSDAESLVYAKESLVEYAEEFDIPILFAQSSPDKQNLFSEIPNVMSAMSAWDNYDYPAVVIDKSCAAAPIQNKTVAFKLYDLIKPDTPLKAPLKDLVVQWGSSVAAISKDKKLLGNIPYKFVDPNITERVHMAGNFFRHSILSGFDGKVVDSNRLLCPYTITIEAHKLTNPDVRRLLQDKVVLVGVSVDGINDSVITPTNGQLPGVYLHAMALDNLLKYGDEYYTRPPFSAGTYIVLTVIMSLFSAWLMVKWKIKVYQIYGITFVGFFVICLAMYPFNHYAPQNWIGFFLICSLSNRLQRAS